MSDCNCDFQAKNQAQKKVLYWLLIINAVMFVLELGTGWIAESTALIADSLDMLADATVYGIGLYAVGKHADKKLKAAQVSGYFQMLLAFLIFFDILRRTMLGSEPVSYLMMYMGFVALIANVFCLLLIYKHKQGDIHMRASWVFSTNDVIANIGVIIGGGLVLLFNSRWPDIVIGSIIVLVILNGAKTILVDVIKERQKLNTRI